MSQAHNKHHTLKVVLMPETMFDIAGKSEKLMSQTNTIKTEFVQRVLMMTTTMVMMMMGKQGLRCLTYFCYKHTRRIKD